MATKVNFTNDLNTRSEATLINGLSIKRMTPMKFRLTSTTFLHRITKNSGCEHVIFNI